jgi:opacity protein-like surface antigen
MKKLTHLLVASAIAVSAASAVADVRNMTGPYAGVNFGYGMGSGKGTMNSANIADAKSKSADMGLSGFRGGFHFGYGQMFQNKFYLALEGSADLSNTGGKIDDKIGTNEYHMEAKRRDAYGLAVRLGGMLGSMLTYAKVGVETAKWNLNASQKNVLANGSETSQSKNQRLTGFVFGLGMETMLTDHIVFGGE